MLRDYDGLGSRVVRRIRRQTSNYAQAVAPAPKPGEITSNPSQYGRTLAVAGEIENIVGPNAFTLDEDKLIGASLLVLVANQRQPTQRSRMVSMSL